MTNVPSIAVVGVGRWGSTLLRTLLEHSDASTAGIYDLDGQRIEKTKDRYPHLRAYGAFSEVLADGSVDAVVIATPMHTHGMLARQALAAGKHVWLEKPMTTDLAEAIALCAQADRHERTLLVGHTPQYAPAAGEIRRRLNTGSIGEPYRMSATRINRGPPPVGVAILWDLVVHDLALALWWLGRHDDEIRFNGTKNLSRSQLKLSLELGPCRLDLESGFAADRHRRLQIIGSRGCLTWTPDQPQRELTFAAPNHPPHVIAVPSVDPLHRQLSDFVESMRSGARPLSDGAHGVRVVSALAGIESALNSHSQPSLVRRPQDHASGAALPTGRGAGRPSGASRNQRAGSKKSPAEH